MSIRTLLSKNNYKLYVDEITLKNLNLSSDGNYKLKFPEDLPINNLPLSIMAVDSIDNNIITLKWLQPSENMPFDVINCNVLNAQQEINCVGNTTLDYLESTSCNIKKVGGAELSGFLVSPLQTESNINYFLPPNRPTTNGQVLSSQINGTLSWIDRDISNFIPKAYKQELLNITLDQDNPTEEIIFNFNLQQGEYYNGVLYGRATKTNPTGSFRFRASVNNTGSLGVIVKPNIALSTGWKTLNDDENDVGININFWIQATQTSVNVIRCELISDITAGGTLLINDISMVISRIAISD
jgi:hypothetical protein